MADINGIPYVESDDLVSAYPTVSQALAQEVSDQLASKLDLAGGKILQIVRDTDGVTRTSTSTTFTDVSGMSVSITPQKSDSAILLLASFTGGSRYTGDGDNMVSFAITDSSNNILAQTLFGPDNYTGTGTRDFFGPILLWGYSTPATTSAVTYKVRFATRSASRTVLALNGTQTAQLYAIEVSA